MGHASIQVTLDRYGHLMPDVNDKAIAVLNDLFTSDSCKDKVNQR